MHGHAEGRHIDPRPTHIDPRPTQRARTLQRRPQSTASRRPNRTAGLGGELGTSYAGKAPDSLPTGSFVLTTIYYGAQTAEFTNTPTPSVYPGSTSAGGRLLCLLVSSATIGPREQLTTYYTPIGSSYTVLKGTTMAFPRCSTKAKVCRCVCACVCVCVCVCECVCVRVRHSVNKEFQYSTHFSCQQQMAGHHMSVPTQRKGSHYDVARCPGNVPATVQKNCSAVCGCSQKAARCGPQTQRALNFRKNYSIQGAMQVCALDRHSVRGPGVAATHHVPPAWSIGFWLRQTLAFFS